MNQGGDRRPTISEVAQHAGVGRSSAARVLGGYGSVSERTRKQVLNSAAALGYETNELARSMSTGVTRTIGVVLADITNPFFAAVLRGISDATRAAGYGTLVVNSDEDPALEDEAVRLLVGKRVDGIVIAPAGGRRAAAEALRWAASRGVRVVQVDRTLDDLAVDAVVMDNRDAAREATRRLLDAGHSRIALAWGPAVPPGTGARVSARRLTELAARVEISSVGERYLGYAEALRAAGVEVDPHLVMTGRQTADGARAFTAGVLDGHAPTAVVCTEVEATIGVLAEVRARGLSVPDDLSLVSFDDSPWAGVLRPTLTTVRQPVQLLGEQAAARLTARLRGEDGPPAVVHLASILVDRESVAAPPAAS
ncbi:LacI family DNA-binding transcriptional regulator [Kineococcus sp. SYSU DK002]|uniref:LacI family DNA-binding transcriptional regulator n=1 Tax=Kineococcus sp. SYSU DK002 TaxID=3383123 RepID=UPI003D7DF894